MPMLEPSSVGLTAQGKGKLIFSISCPLVATMEGDRGIFFCHKDLWFLLCPYKG